MRKIAQQSVRYIDCAVGQRQQFQPERDARRRPIQPHPATLGGRRLQFQIAAPVCNRRRGVAKLAGHPDVVADFRAVASQRPTPRALHP